MIHRGIATFGLDGGHCPPPLYERMVRLGRQVLAVIVEEYGSDEVVKRMGDPGWFQSLGTVLAFDWNASGLTTVMTAALKEAVRGNERALGFAICGGKGKTSRKTPEEIGAMGEILRLAEGRADRLVYNSKMAAKVDSNLLQDGFDLYHHAFFFSRNGAWTVVQQGMNKDTRSARRYHWHSGSITDLVVEPHSGIASATIAPALNLTAKASVRTQQVATELVQGSYQTLGRDLEILSRYSSHLSQSVHARRGQQQLRFVNLEPREFHSHPVVRESFRTSPYLKKVLQKVVERRPENFERLVALEGVGARTIRALSLVAEVIYGAAPSYDDPARYSFAHGGKDATPYPVDYETYDRTINFFRTIVPKLNVSREEKQLIGRRLTAMASPKAL